ncbi:MAG: hypothetical protein ACT4QG_21485 [Sporichthyaceae bacterium]
MERIRPVNAPPDDEENRPRPERFSPYAVPLSTLVAGAYVSQQDQHIVVPDPVSPMSVPVGPEGGGGDGD